MEKSQMKNIVVLKNLPSNLIEEALVIVKSNKMAKRFEYIDKKENLEKKENSKGNNDYIIREAESVISSYINIIEKKESKKKDFKLIKKYKGLKIYSACITIALFVMVFFL